MPAPQGSPRGLVVAALTPLGWPIIQGRWPGNISRRSLAVTVGDIAAQGTGTALLWTVTTTVLTPITGESADDDLEGAVIEVLNALEAAQPLMFAGGRRAVVLADGFNAYDLDAQVITRRS